MKKRRTVTCAMVLVLLTLIFFSIPIIKVYKMASSYTSVINANWGYEITSKVGLKEIYGKDTGASFHGDGTRYHVFSYKEDNEILNLFDWNTNNQQTRHYKSVEETLNNWLEEIGVSDSERPDFDSCVYWYETQLDDEILILWDKNKKCLYVVEDFM